MKTQLVTPSMVRLFKMLRRNGVTAKGTEYKFDPADLYAGQTPYVEQRHAKDLR